MDYASSLLGLLPGGRRTPGLKELLGIVGTYLPPDQVERIREAAEFGASAHQGQKRLSGEPFIAHPVAAASILADLHLDPDSIIAAILHDVIEDTPTPKDRLAERFGADVAELVDGVTKLDQIKFKSREEAQAESFRKMLLAMVRDLRVVLVKLADRTHNMRTIDAVSLPRRRAIARETLDIYAPIAERLGLYSLKLELEDLGFAALYPERYRVLEKTLKRARGNQKEFLKKIEQQITAALMKNGIAARVETREKHLYSIYKKMRRKRSTLNEIVDVYGLRIVVDSADTCYRALGSVHAVFKPMPGRFKDYIAIPRVNGYQSLHTTLFGPNGVPIEVQIRTDDMHRVAESGIAAHWRYKTGDEIGSAQQEHAREWLRHLVELQESGSSEEFLESVKVDLFPDKVYVFTPRGEILRLPSGSTVVDFAYAVHTDIGNRCVAAKVDRRLTPLRTVLRNGQTVEIITAKGAMPNPAWVNFVVSAKARSAIRHYLKGLRRTEAIGLGQRLLNQSLSEFHLSVEEISPQAVQAAVAEVGMKDVDELFEKIGLGERLAPFVARRLVLPLGAQDGAAAGSSSAGGASPAAGGIAAADGSLAAAESAATGGSVAAGGSPGAGASAGSGESPDAGGSPGAAGSVSAVGATPLLGGEPPMPSGSLAPLAVAGTEGLLVSYARCCYPIPYDPIFAFLSSGRGIVIHRETCVNVEDYRKHPEKWLPVSWQAATDRYFTSQIRVDVPNRMGMLAAVAASIASTETNIDHVSLDERDLNTSTLMFELKVRDRKHLARIIRTIRRMPEVLRVARTIAAHSSTKGRRHDS